MRERELNRGRMRKRGLSRGGEEEQIDEERDV